MINLVESKAQVFHLRNWLATTPNIPIHSKDCFKT